jgi:hypothetical protein
VAGYSGTPLPTKLGIKEGHRVWISGGPPDLLPGVPLVRSARAPIDVAVVFVKTIAEYRKAIDRMHQVLAPDGGFWVAWPKKSSGVATELTEDVIRDIAVAETTLVDNKVCAIDETWSGLRLVVRKEARTTWPVAPGPARR